MIDFFWKIFGRKKFLVRFFFDQDKNHFDDFLDGFLLVGSNEVTYKKSASWVPGSASKVCGGGWWNVNLVFCFGPNLRLEA